MKSKAHLSKILCIVGFVAAALGICVLAYFTVSYHQRLDATLTQLSEAEARVDTCNQNNEELQRRNEELIKTLDVYDHDFEINAPTPPQYMDVPVEEDLQAYIWSLCCEYDIEEQYVLIYAIMRKESNFRSDVISATNDYGLMQINISNHGNLSRRLGITDFLDPYQNVHAGIYMFANALHKYGSVSDALMAYNLGGGGAARLWSQGVHSTYYSESVLAYYNQFMENI